MKLLSRKNYAKYHHRSKVEVDNPNWISSLHPSISFDSNRGVFLNLKLTPARSDDEREYSLEIPDNDIPALIEKLQSAYERAIELRKTNRDNGYIAPGDQFDPEQEFAELNDPADQLFDSSGEVMDIAS